MAKKNLVNYVIEAGAGCGKSTTLEWTETKTPKGITPSDQQQAIFDALRPKRKAKNRKVRVACFNTSIMDELVPRFPDADVRNNHKIALHALKKKLNINPRNYVDTRKYNNIAKMVIGNPYDDHSLFQVTATALKLVDMARSTLTGDCDESSARWFIDQGQIIDMADFYNIDLEDGEALRYVEEIINIGIGQARHKIDFTDMIFQPRVYNAKPDKVDRLYIDEMQDLNAAQHWIHYDTAEQIVVVGDEYQSIYGFTGADPESMSRFGTAINARSLPLTITRRCPKRHVELAKRYLPDTFGFRAADDAPDGAVMDCAFDDNFYKQLEGKDNLLLSRTNAPMVAACFSCWKAGIPALIRGRDVAANLANAIKRHSKKDETSAEVAANIMEEYDAKIANYRAQDKDDMAAAKTDERDVILTFLAETKTPKEAIDAIWNMFDDKAKARAVQFSTVHKAKGLEAEIVGILTPSLLPHPGISKMGEFWLRQELNIAYVCYTRSKSHLYLNSEG